jgi:hypothetical protein
MRFLKQVTLFLLIICGLEIREARASHPPTLAVHESLYGTETSGKNRQSVQQLAIRLYSRDSSQSRYVVECFFLKKGKTAELPSINDTVIFEVTDPRATYEVTAKPIKLPPPPKAAKSKPSKKSSKKGSKKSASKQVKPTAADYPREGYIVRVLCDGSIVRSMASNHQLERLAKEAPKLLNQSAAAKSARHLDVEAILKK